jgi:hypothetical protein
MLSTLIMSAAVGLLAPRHSEVLIWGSMGLVMVLVLGFALMWFRRKYHTGGSSDGNQTSSFSIQSFEEMRASGQISDEEFRRLRAGLFGLDTPAVDSDNSALSESDDLDDGAEEPDPDNKPQDHEEIK